MAGKQVPTLLGVGIAVVGLPLLLMDVRGTHDKMVALNTPEARQAACIKNMKQFDLVRSETEGLCGCIVRKADKLGANGSYGSYDKQAFKPIVDQCYADYVAHSDS